MTPTRVGHISLRPFPDRPQRGSRAAREAAEEIRVVVSRITDDPGGRSQYPKGETERLGSDDRSAGALAQLYAHRVPLYVRQIEHAYRLGNRWSDDLTSAGYWGLAKALSNRREGALEVELSAYVSRRIRGAVIDEVRTCLTRNTRGEWLLENPEDALASEGILNRGAAANRDCPERTAERRRTRRVIETAITELSDGQRRIARAFMWGKSWDEIAEDEGVSVSTVRSRFRTVALRLRKRVPQLMHPTR